MLTAEQQLGEARWRQEMDDRIWGVAEASTTKADALLQERLGVAAYRLFQQTGKLMRPSKIWPGIEYLLRRGQRVQAVKDAQVVAELCVQSRAGEPEADRLLTILDLIESDERRLWEMARVTFPKEFSLALAPPDDPVPFLSGRCIICSHEAH